MKELLVFVTLYACVLGGHNLGAAITAWRERRKQVKAMQEANAAGLAPLSPLVCVPLPATPPCWYHKCGKHFVAGTVAALSSPAGAETVKHYVVHFLIYSGYVLPGH